jgi:hypothetical protein
LLGFCSSVRAVCRIFSFTVSSLLRSTCSTAEPVHVAGQCRYASALLLRYRCLQGRWAGAVAMQCASAATASAASHSSPLRWQFKTCCGVHT